MQYLNLTLSITNPINFPSILCILFVKNLRLVGRVENRVGVEKWENRKNFSFLSACLAEGAEKWRDEFFFFFNLIE